MTRLRPLLVLAVTASVAAGVVSATTATAATPPPPRFASAAVATVTPGVQTVTGGAQCTANFVFTDPRGVVYLGQAAHCAGTGESTETDGCLAPTLPLGTPVEVEGAGRTGVLAYSSWVAMKRVRERDPETCAYNDLSLIRLDPADVRRTNPSVPFFGGPTGLAGPAVSGSKVASYGNSSLRLGLRDLSPKRGISLGGTSWTTDVYTATPGIPGDSGSGFLDSAGRAFGTLSTVAIAPLAGSNGVGSLVREIAYARTHGIPGLTLVKGTVPFAGVNKVL